MPSFSWGLFAVLVGTLLPFSVVVRSIAQIIHDRHLGLTHTLNLYRIIKAVLVVPFLTIIGPVGFFLMFGPGDPELAARVIKFLGTTRGYISTGALLIGVLLIDVYRPRLADQLSRIPISDLSRTKVQFQSDTGLLVILMGLAFAAATFTAH